MAEYIDREAALEICDKEYKERLRMHDYCGDTVAWNIGGAIKGLPCADVAPVVHGRLEDSIDEWLGTDVYTCSKCRESYVLVEGTPKENLWHYCPNCGAKMDGDGNADH